MSYWNLDKDIWWVRHGESSSNLHENAIEDQYKDDNVEKNFQAMRNEYKRIENNNYNYNEDEILKYNIEKGIEILREKFETLEKDKDSKDSKDKKDLGKMISVWDDEIENNNSWSEETEERGKITYKPPTSWLFTPTLSYAGILHSIEAGKNLYDKINTSAEDRRNKIEGGAGLMNPNNDHEKTLIFITSASVRTIMTAIYTLLSYNEEVENKRKGKKIEKIYVMPYINEQTNGAGCCKEPNLDRANTGIPSHLLQKVIKLIAEFVASPNIEGVVLTSKNVIGMIDTGYYMDAEKNDKEFYDKSDLEKFVGVFNTFKTEREEYDDTFYNNNRVIAFTHGNFINHKLRKPYLESKGEEEEENKEYYKLNVLGGPHIFPNNCSVWPFSIEEEEEEGEEEEGGEEEEKEEGEGEKEKYKKEEEEKEKEEEEEEGEKEKYKKEEEEKEKEKKIKINASYPYMKEIKKNIEIRKREEEKIDEEIEEAKGKGEDIKVIEKKKNDIVKIFIPSIAGGGVRSGNIITPKEEEEENKKFATLTEGNLCREINDLYPKNLFHSLNVIKKQLAAKGVKGGGKKGRKTKRRHRRKVTRKIKRKSSGSNKNRTRITRRKRITKRKKYIKS